MMPHSGSDSTYPTVQISGTTSVTTAYPLFQTDITNKLLARAHDVCPKSHLIPIELMPIRLWLW